MSIYQRKPKVVVGVTAASGMLYAKILFDKLKALQDQMDDCGLIFSQDALKVWNYELEGVDVNAVPWTIYKPDDFFAPMASGSSGYNTMIICPCTMGTLGRIAAGTAQDLMTRAADVVLKEKGKLILVVRETPFNLIHLVNMKLLTEAGAVICPASPSFYGKPGDIASLATSVVDRVLTLAGFDLPHYRWQEGEG